IGPGAGAYAGFTQTGGAATLGGFLVVGLANDTAVYNQSGGTMTLTNAPATIGAGNTACIGVASLSGSAVLNLAAAAGNGVWPGEVGTGILNVSGSAALIVTNDGVILGKANAGGNGILNLLGG